MLNNWIVYTMTKLERRRDSAHTKNLYWFDSLKFTSSFP